MMSNEEIDELAKDIKANGLRNEIIFLYGHHMEKGDPDILIDGRNRLEAMERAGVSLQPWQRKNLILKSEAQIWAYVLGQNLHRRHLTKQERADAIVAAAREATKKKPGQAGPVLKTLEESPSSVSAPPAPKADSRPADSARPVGTFRGGRGKRSPIKEAALGINQSLPTAQQVSERTIKRSIAKSEGRLPEPSKIAGRRLSSRPKDMQKHVGIDAARLYYLDRCAEPDIDLDHEREIVLEAFRELAGQRALRSAAPSGEGYPELPRFLDRRPR
jgi:hypothetical protein